MRPRPADDSDPGVVGSLDRVLRVAHLRQDVEHLVDPSQCGGGPLREGDRHADHPERPDEQRDVHVELHQRAEGEVAVDHLVPTEPQDSDQPDLGQQLHRRQVLRPDPCRLDRLATDVVGLDAELVGLDPLGTEPLDDADPAHGLFDHRGELGLLRLHGEYRRVDRPRESATCHLDQRERGEGEDGELPVGDEQDDRHRDDHREVRQGDRDHHHEHLDLVEIARRATHQLPGLGPVVVADVQRHDVTEEPFAQPGLGPAGLAEREEATQRREEPGEQPGERDEPGPQPQHLTLFDAAVDTEPDQQRRHHLADRPGEADQRADQQVPPLRPQRLPQQRPGGDRLGDRQRAFEVSRAVRRRGPSDVR